MNAQETTDLITFMDPVGGVENARKMVPVLFTDAPLGVACHLLACSCCSEEFILFHPIPLKLPVECPECGKVQGYIVEELR